VRAKATTYCGVPAPDRGWVESQSSASPVLSKVLSNVSVNRISPNKIEVMFTASETSNIKKYNIRISEDGTTYKTVKVIVPNGLTQDKTYRVILNQ
jgi:NMD protein affecting ribosome stability and mRNA decay